jgi:hypothetical protein
MYLKLNFHYSSVYSIYTNVKSNEYCFDLLAVKFAFLRTEKRANGTLQFSPLSLLQVAK